ncbi:uncharacterized protein LOC125538958 isoform X2 [Triticum urartu]|nr:uncharacterized protein LOC125538958 isoform X2 [Triticum urartu]
MPREPLTEPPAAPFEPQVAVPLLLPSGQMRAYNQEHVAEERRRGTQHGAEEQWRGGYAEGMFVRTKRYEVVTPLENIMDMEPLRIWMNSMSMST